jgi:hypothetical protein
MIERRQIAASGCIDQLGHFKGGASPMMASTSSVSILLFLHGVQAELLEFAPAGHAVAAQEAVQGGAGFAGDGQAGFPCFLINQWSMPRSLSA